MGSKTSCMGAIILLSMLFMPTFIHALMAPEIRELRTKHRLSSLLVFGDSSVDPGNNNRITTTMKSNFLPYGMDFVGGRPTGRFCDGKLGTDFVGKNITTPSIPFYLQYIFSFASSKLRNPSNSGDKIKKHPNYTHTTKYTNIIVNSTSFPQWYNVLSFKI